MRDLTVRYLPQDLVDAVHMWAPEEISDSEMWALERLIEAVYSRGYDDGHRRGDVEGRQANRRPNQNDINALREKLRGEPKGGESDA